MLRGGNAFMGNAAVTLIGSGLGAALTVINEALAAHAIGPDGYGLYAIGMMFAKIGEILAVFGLPLAILHYLPVHLSRSDSRLALGTILGGAGLPLLLGLAFAASLWASAGWIARAVFADPDAAMYIAILGLAIPALTVADLLGNVARGFGRPVTYVLIRNVIPPLIYMVALVHILNTGAAGAILNSGAAGAAVAKSYWAATACGALAGIVVVGNMIWRRIGLVRPEFQLRSLYAYATPVILNSVFALAIVWTDLLLLGIFTEPATVGMYRACMQAAIAFDLIWNACSAATAPLYSVLVVGGNWERLQQIYGTAIRVAVLLTLPLYAIVFVNAADILGLLHPDFRAAAMALTILAAGHAVKTSFGAASVLLVVGGQPLREARNGALAAVLNLGLNLALIPRFGLLGAATATATTLTAISLLRCWQVRRAFGIVSFDRSIPRAVVANCLVALSIAAGAAALGVGPGNGPGAFVARLAIMAVVLAMTLWWGCLAQEDRTALIGLLSRRATVIVRPTPL